MSRDGARRNEASRLSPSTLLTAEWRAVEDGEGDRIEVQHAGAWRARVHVRHEACVALCAFAKGECVAAWHAYSFAHGEIALDTMVSASCHADVNVICWRGRGSVHTLRAIQEGEALVGRWGIEREHAVRPLSVPLHVRAHTPVVTESTPHAFAAWTCADIPFARHPRRNDERTCRVMFIDEIAASVGVRGRQLRTGIRLLQQAVTLAQAQKCDEIHLVVKTANAQRWARNLYTLIGMEKMSPQRGSVH